MESGKDFENWAGSGYGRQVFDGELGDDGVYTVRDGRWSSPRFPAQSQSFFHFSYETRSPIVAYATARCYDSDGTELAADNYTGIDPSEDWLPADLFFVTRPNSRHASVTLESTGRDLQVRNAIVRPASRRYVLQWMDRFYATLPPVNFSLQPDPWQNIERSHQVLRDKGTLRVLLLGDSIANDFSNSHFQLLLERRYPGSSIHLTTSVRGSTGCNWYRHENRVQPYVLDHNPDLVIILSLGLNQIPALLDVIHQVRAKIDCEFLVMTDAVSLPSTKLSRLSVEDAREFIANAGNLRADAIRRAAYFCKRMKNIAHTEQIGVFNLRQAWEDYLVTCGKPNAWFLRDGVHANERAKQIIARIVEIQFSDRET